MGRRPLPPKGLVAGCLGDVARQMLDATFYRNAKSTVTSKTSLMRGVVECLGKDKQVWTLTSGDLDQALRFLVQGADAQEAETRRKAGRKPRTGRHTKGSVVLAERLIRQFVTYCHRHRLLDVSVELQTPISQSAKERDDDSVSTEYVRISSTDWPRVLDLAGQVHPRCRMAVALGLYCGRRVSEIVRLQWKDINWETNVITFTNVKRSKAKMISIAPQLAAELEIWRRWTFEAGYGQPQPDWYLVPNRL